MAVELHAVYTVTEETGGMFYLSPDGEKYIGVDLPRLPMDLTEDEAEAMRDQVVKLMEGKANPERRSRTIPMTYARRWFRQIAQADYVSDVTLFRWVDGEWENERTYKFQGAMS
jgi:hypothetical protein